MPSWDPLAGLAEEQRETLRTYQRLLARFNRKINLVSREDVAHVEHHVRHALALAWKCFPAGSAVVDWGTGGGLPAIPLAVAFPEVEVHAVDAVGKKVRAVRAMARRLGLGNLYAWHGRAEAWPGSAQYSVSRATAPLAVLWRWHLRIFEPSECASGTNCWSPGLLCLKGGKLEDEIAALRRSFPEASLEMQALEPRFGDAAFSEKFLITVR